MNLAQLKAYTLAPALAAPAVASNVLIDSVTGNRYKLVMINGALQSVAA